RPLFMEYPDPSLLKVEDEYLVGPALLSAPVITRGARTRTVTLPEGQWLDWNAGAVVSGTGDADAPLDVLPLYLRERPLPPLLHPTAARLPAPPPAPGVGGPARVADVCGVVALRGPPGGAPPPLFAGPRLDVAWQGGFAAPSLPQAASEAELATCAGCWLK